MNLSDTRYPNGRTESGTRPGVWLYHKPMDLSASGHGKGGGECTTLMSDMLQSNCHTGTGTRSGVCVFYYHSKNPSILSVWSIIYYESMKLELNKRLTLWFVDTINQRT